MGRKDTDRDVEKASSEKSPSSLRSHSPALTKEPDITSVDAPPSNTEDILKIPSHSTSSDLSSHGDNHVPHPRPASLASSTTPEPVKVPRGKRRGLFARLAVIAEVEEPHHYSRKSKWMVTFIIAVAGAAAPMGSSVILPALLDIARAFDSTETVTNLSVAFYMLSMSIFPLWWSSFSETLGRRTIYISSFGLFCVFNVLSATSVNISMFIVCRILSGGAAASVQAVGAGTIADVWEVKERGRAMGIFYLGPLCGPLLSPIIGGALTQGLGWRAALWFMVIYGVVLELLVIFGLPETLKARKPIAAIAEAEATAETEKKKGRPTLSCTTTTQSVHIKAKKYAAIFRRCFLDPLAIVLHLRRPPVAITVYYASVTFCSLYALNISVQQTFALPPYSYSTIIIGLLYIPNSVGYFLASVFGGKWVDRIMHREARNAGRYDEHGKLIFIPEDRMRENVYVAAVMYPAALLWYGWTAQKGVYVVAPVRIKPRRAGLIDWLTHIR